MFFEKLETIVTVVVSFYKPTDNNELLKQNLENLEKLSKTVKYQKNKKQRALLYNMRTRPKTS